MALRPYKFKRVGKNGLQTKVPISKVSLTDLPRNPSVAIKVAHIVKQIVRK